jgi:hypothetical protein
MRPLILDYAIERTGDDKPIFEYSNILSLNVVRTKNTIIPFIEIDNRNCEMQTKTRVQREQDDESISLLEIATKTKIAREKDDENFSLLELSTKTEVRREQDDDHLTLLEITTKTFVNRERDDEDSFDN